MAAKLILIVGVESALAGLVREVVEPEVNAIVRIVPTAEQALTFVQNIRPALILVDDPVTAPAGPALCRRLRATGDLADVPIVILGSDHQDDEARASGAIAYLTKPVDAERLRRAMRKGV